MGIGFLKGAAKANADDPDGTCTITKVTTNLDTAQSTTSTYSTSTTKFAACVPPPDEVGTKFTTHYSKDWKAGAATNPPCQYNAQGAATNEPCVPDAAHQPVQRPAATPNALDSRVDSLECVNLTGGSPGGCIVKIAYFLWYQIPAAVLGLVGAFFDTFLSLTLGSAIYNNSFISEGWAVVRDLANMFFIVVLLYIALQIILGLTHHGVKQMIAKVIIMALLINFSMFFTKVIIDTSNILALVFYNKILVVDKTGDAHQPVLASAKTGVTEKPVSTAFIAAFNPAQLTSEDMFKKATEQAQTSSVLRFLVRAGLFVVTAGGSAFFGAGSQNVPIMFYLTIILVSGAMFIFVAYTFFMAAFSFLGRMVELWVLLIAAPFAFMTFAFPALDKVEYAGWHSWSEKLLKTAFMAPIFMFFLYLISKLIHINIFKDLVNNENQGWVASILVIVIPTMINMVLLNKAVGYAKKGSGQVGEMLSKVGGQVAGLAGGLALGAATGGASAIGRATIGRAGAAASSSEWAKKWESKYFGGETVMAGLKKIGGASFDVRAVSKTMEHASVGHAHKGGFIQQREEDIKKRQQRAKEIEVGPDEALTQDLRELEVEKQNLMRAGSHAIGEVDKQIKMATTASRELQDALRAETPGTAAHTAIQARARAAAARVLELRTQRSTIKDAKGANAPALAAAAAAARARAVAAPANIELGMAADAAEAAAEVARLSALGRGRSINQLEDYDIPHAHHEIEEENRKRQWEYAAKLGSGLNKAWNLLISGGEYSVYGANEAAHKIRMEAKLEDKGGGDHH
jgi:hypothetical protein